MLTDTLKYLQKNAQRVHLSQKVPQEVIHTLIILFCAIFLIMFVFTPLIFLYFLFLFFLIYLPGRNPKIQTAMQWWWFRLAFILTVVSFVVYVDVILCMFDAALYVVLHPLYPEI